MEIENYKKFIDFENHLSKNYNPLFSTNPTDTMILAIINETSSTFIERLQGVIYEFESNFLKINTKEYKKDFVTFYLHRFERFARTLKSLNRMFKTNRFDYYDLKNDTLEQSPLICNPQNLSTLIVEYEMEFTAPITNIIDICKLYEFDCLEIAKRACRELISASEFLENHLINNISIDYKNKPNNLTKPKILPLTLEAKVALLHLTDFFKGTDIENIAKSKGVLLAGIWDVSPNTVRELFTQGETLAIKHYDTVVAFLKDLNAEKLITNHPAGKKDTK